ncbi:lycopene cyclase family protein [Pelagibacteraceae bacterium]|nr:lycopene cyclase family protein [Pelagibacteraceae bacterium]
MKEFDYIIIGGGCSGLSLAYELQITKKLENKSLAIIEIRSDYKRDKTWSFWKVFDHNFDDCVIKSWNNFTINSTLKSQELRSQKFPYQSVDSGLFYKKIIDLLSKNKNIQFFKNLDQINTTDSFIFNSIPEKQKVYGTPDPKRMWQHFKGIEIETDKDIFDDEIINLMDFNCEQRNNVHFFYTLPFEKNRALIETTWLSLIDSSLNDYDKQIDSYIKKNLGIKKFKINYEEEGAIPLFRPINVCEKNKMNIGSAGGMTRLSTGYTFLNIQEHSRYICENIDKIEELKIYNFGKKYEFLDNIFLRVLKEKPDIMPDIFFNMFKASPDTVIKFLSNKSNILEDLSVILKMPKLTFIKALFK